LRFQRFAKTEEPAVDVATHDFGHCRLSADRNLIPARLAADVDLIDSG
jgi:hypothetical protein